MQMFNDGAWTDSSDVIFTTTQPTNVGTAHVPDL